MTFKRPSKELLEDLFCERQWTQRRIATELGANVNSVSSWLIYYGLPTRTTHRLPDREGLIELFHTQNKTVTQIAKKFHINSDSVYKKLKELDIPLKYKDRTRKFLPILDDTTRKIVAWSICWEGSITLNKNSGSSRQLMPKITIGNTNLSLLKQFNDLVRHGYVVDRPFDKRKQHPLARPQWRWNTLRLEEIISLLSQIIDYLPAKKEQARLLLEFSQLRLAQKHLINRKKKYGKREFQIYREMKELNKRGIRDGDYTEDQS